MLAAQTLPPTPFRASVRGTGLSCLIGMGAADRRCGPASRSFRPFVTAAALVGLLTLVGVTAVGTPGLSHPSASGLEPDHAFRVIPADPGPRSPSAEPGDLAAVEPSPPVSSPERLVPACEQHPAGDYVESFETTTGPRSYRIHVPAVERDLPLVLNFHGSGGSASEQEAYSGLLPLSDLHGFILVSPEGSGSPSGWNVAGIYHEDGVDDVAAMATLLQQVEAESCVDPAHLYATGFSNGAQMAAQVACALPAVFAAVAPVSGAVYQDCDGPAVAVIAFHGIRDVNVDYNWAYNATRQWASHNGCSAAQATAVAEHAVAEAFQNCAADVIFYTLADAGHTWPGSVDGSGGAGPVNHEIDAAALIWQFFQAHSKRA